MKVALFTKDVNCRKGCMIVSVFKEKVKYVEVVELINVSNSQISYSSQDFKGLTKANLVLRNPHKSNDPFLFFVFFLEKKVIILITAYFGNGIFIYLFKNP